MKLPRIALMGAALALAGISTTASAYVTTEVYTEPLPVVRVTPVTTREVYTVNGQLAYSTYDSSRVVAYDNPTYVQRTYIEPRQTVVVESNPVVVTARPYYGAYYDPDPQMGQLIDHGLFNRHGPNDFGR